MTYPPKNIKRGALHHELGIPDDQRIGERNLERICHAPLGEQIMMHGREFTVDAHMKKQACFAANFAYGRKR